MIWVGPRVLIRGRCQGQSQRSCDSERRGRVEDAVFLVLWKEGGAEACGRLEKLENTRK